MSQVFSDNILYYDPTSIYSNVAVLLLCEKSIQEQFEFKPLQMGVDNIAPWYIKLNAIGQVPTLIHLGKPIYETLDIARHLDKSFGPTPVFGMDDMNVLIVVDRWRKVRFVSLVEGKKNFKQDTSQLEWNLDETRQKILKFMLDYPELKSAYSLRLSAHDDRANLLLHHSAYIYNKSELENLLRNTERALKENDGYLVPNNKNHTLADIYATAILYWLISKYDKDILKDRPLLNEYYSKQVARPSFARAFFN